MIFIFNNTHIVQSIYDIMNKLVGDYNYDHLKYFDICTFFPEFKKNEDKYIHHTVINSERLEIIKIAKIKNYNGWIIKYLPHMINLEIIFISLDNITTNTEKYLTSLIITTTIKILIIKYKHRYVLRNLFDNLPVTLEKLIIIDEYPNATKRVIFKEGIKYLPFGCEIYFCFDHEENCESIVHL